MAMIGSLQAGCSYSYAQIHTLINCRYLSCSCSPVRLENHLCPSMNLDFSFDFVLLENSGYISCLWIDIAIHKLIQYYQEACRYPTKLISEKGVRTVAEKNEKMEFSEMISPYFTGYYKKNLVNLLELVEVDKKSTIAEQCKIDSSTLNRYMDPGNVSSVSLENLIRICTTYGFSLDTFVSEDMTSRKTADLLKGFNYEFYAPYSGCYLAYYLDINKMSLKYGILCLDCEELYGGGGTQYRPYAIAGFSMSLQDALILKDLIEKEQQHKKANAKEKDIKALFNSVCYTGRFDVDDGIISIQLKKSTLDDSVLILLPNSRNKNRPDKPYIGGVGVLNSKAKMNPGSLTAPCAQKTLISRYTVDEDMLVDSSLLSVTTVDADTYNEQEWDILARKAIDITRSFTKHDEKQFLTEEDLAGIISKNLKNLCLQHSRSKPQTNIHISPQDDRRGYDIIKSAKR